MANERTGSVGDLIIQVKITNKLLAAQLKEKMKQQELIEVLGSTGATDKEIADVLGTTPATVAVAKQRLRKRASQKLTKTAATADPPNLDA